MLMCCNTFFYGVYNFVLQNNSYGFRRLEFGVCPQCGSYCFLDYKKNSSGNLKIKRLYGREAITKYKLWKDRFSRQKQGTYSNNNIYYGDFRKTRRIDEFGNPIYIQLRKNFNNQTEILNEVKTIHTHIPI